MVLEWRVAEPNVSNVLGAGGEGLGDGEVGIPLELTGYGGEGRGGKEEERE